MRTTSRHRALGAALAAGFVVLACLGFATSDAARIAEPNARVATPHTATIGSTASHAGFAREATLTSTPRAKPAKHHDTVNWTILAAGAVVLIGAGWILRRRGVVTGFARPGRHLRLRGPPLLLSV